jgi:fructokinase
MPFHVVGVGELLWDLLPNGRQLGGAPANFAYHAAALGAQATLVSRVGNDEPGREALNQLGNLGVSIDCVEVDSVQPTGTVEVEIGAGGQPNYQIRENVAWDALKGESPGRHAVAKASAVCFGSLAQRGECSRKTIRSLVASAPAKAWRIFDVNLRQNYFSKVLVEESLALANVLKVNETELSQLAAMFGLTGEPKTQIEELARRCELRAVAYTRGQQGSLLLADRQWSDHPGIRSQVVDTIGAGDSFTAALVLGLLAGWELQRINDTANQVAAYVCVCAGAMPPLPERLRKLFN